MPLPSLTQDATDLAIEWVEGDVISLAFTVLGVDWTGTYECKIIDEESSGLIIELDVSATVVGSDTLFVLSATELESETAPAGDYLWGLREVGGMTRFKGPATILRRMVPV